MGIVGRNTELDALKQALRGFKIITILAPGGLGKTTLAEALYDALRDVGTVHFIPLSRHSTPNEDGVVYAAAQALGVLPDRLFALLAQSPETLLILDNAEQALPAVQSFLNELQEVAPDTRVILTSCEPTGLEGELVFRLNPLDEQAATELFIQRARRLDFQFQPDPTELAALVKALDGIPLAIEMAASQTLVASLSEILAHIESRVIDVQERRMGRVLEDSWMGLSLPLRSALRRLSILHEGFDLQAAAALIENHESSVEALTQRAWLFRYQGRDGVRFRIPRVLQSFARSRLHEVPAEFKDVLERVGEYFAGLHHVGRFGRCPPEWVQNIYELTPLVGQTSLKVRMVRAAEFSARLHFGFERWCTLAMQTRLSGEFTSLESAHLLWCEALADLAEGHIPEGIERAEEVLRQAVEDQDIGLQGDACLVLGSSLVENGRLQEGGELFERGVGLVEGVEELQDLHSALLQKLAMVQHVTALENQHALANARKAVDVARRAQDPYQEARALSTQAAIVMGLGDLERAKRTFEAAEKIDAQLDDWMCLSMGQLNLGNIALKLDDDSEAMQSFARAANTARQTGNAMVEAMAMVGQAVISLKRGTPTIALLEDALRLIEGIDVHVERIGALAELAVHQSRRGDFADADTTLTKAWRVALHIDEANWVAIIACYRALTLYRLGAPKADAWLQKAAERVPELADAFERQIKGDASATADIWPASWVPHDPMRILAPPKTLDHNPTLELKEDGRLVILPDGQELDFSRRGPLRLLLLALAQAAKDRRVLDVSDLLEAAWPGEIVTYDAARMRVYTSVKRLRRMGLEDWIHTTDEGYSLSSELVVKLALQRA